MSKTALDRVVDDIVALEDKMTEEQKKRADIYHEQIEAVMEHMRHTAELADDEYRRELWWVGDWPAWPRAAATEVAYFDNDHHNWDFGKLLDAYRSDLIDNDMQDRLASLDEILEDVGCDIFD